MKLSVVIPTYERPEMLSRLLESIALQTRPPDEVIVVDDGSKKEYDLSKWQDRFAHFQSIKHPKPLGAPTARNRGIFASTGDWIALVDDDDEWLPNKLMKQCALIENDCNLGLVYTWTDAMLNGEVVHRYRSCLSGAPLKELITECFIPSPSVLVKKEALIMAGLFDPVMESCQDWDLWTRIVRKGYTIAALQSVETLYHKHDLPTIGTSKKAHLGHLRYLQKHRALYWRYFPKKALRTLITCWRHL